MTKKIMTGEIFSKKIMSKMLEKRIIYCPSHGNVEVDVFKGEADDKAVCPYCEKINEARHTAAIEKMRKLEAMGLYEEHYEASLDNFFPPTHKAKTHLEAIKGFAKKPGRKCLVFYGNSGTGKSKLLSALVKELGGKYTTYEWLNLRIKSSYSPRAEYSEEKIFKELCAIPFLAIDEIEKGPDKDRIEHLSFIIRERYERHKPLALAGNFTWNWLKETFDGSIINRWQCAGQSFEFDWDSYRPNLRGE